MQYTTVLIKMEYACTHYETGQGSSLDARFSTSFIFSNNIYDRLRSASRLKSASFPNAQIYGRFIYYGQGIHHWTSIWESEKGHIFENLKKDIDLRIGRRFENLKKGHRSEVQMYWTSIWVLHTYSIYAYMYVSIFYSSTRKAICK
jgi:hypothetical protein